MKKFLEPLRDFIKEAPAMFAAVSTVALFTQFVSRIDSAITMEQFLEDYLPELATVTAPITQIISDLTSFDSATACSIGIIGIFLFAIPMAISFLREKEEAGYEGYLAFGGLISTISYGYTLWNYGPLNVPEFTTPLALASILAAGATYLIGRKIELKQVKEDAKDQLDTADRKIEDLESKVNELQDKVDFDDMLLAQQDSKDTRAENTAQLAAQ